MPRARPVLAAGAPSQLDFISYVRVSTDGQGRSGLGLDAQKEAVAQRIKADGGRLVAEFEEVESGKRSDRPQLALALAACRARRAVLVIAKLDRLARNTAFLLSIVEGTGSAGVIFCDLPDLPRGPSGKFILTMFAAVAELEAGMISQRTKAALAQAKARGVKLGNPNLRPGDSNTAKIARAARTKIAAEYARDVQPYIDAARKAGCTSLRQFAAALTARGIQPPSGGDTWHASQVRRIIQQQDKHAAD
jgi:DNA invertase Pin-like site-specific DNA recombinase